MTCQTEDYHPPRRNGLLVSSDPDWMKPIDERILEFLAQTERVKVGGLWFKPAGIARNVGHDRDYVNRRLRVLLERELVEQSSDGYYRITTDGTEFVRSI